MWANSFEHVQHTQKLDGIQLLKETCGHRPRYRIVFQNTEGKDQTNIFSEYGIYGSMKTEQPCSHCPFDTFHEVPLSSFGHHIQGVTLQSHFDIDIESF